MKSQILWGMVLSAVSVFFVGCAELLNITDKFQVGSMSKAQLEFQLDKTVGSEYYVSVQSVKKYSKPCASSKAVGMLKMGDKVTVSEIVPLDGHLATDKADSWLAVTGDKGTFYIPGNVVVGQELWEAQLNGLPPRGGVKVKNFTSSKHQDADADLNVADRLTTKEIFFILGAAGAVKSNDGKAYPAQLAQYIKQQHKGAKAPTIRLPKSERSVIELPSPKSFIEIGPYQEFDMGAGLAVYMMKQALAPNHPVTRYVAAIVNRLAAKSTLPMPYGGYNVVVLKDDKTVNACAAPGGFIFVTTGMLKYLKSEEELALIIAHEIGHLEFHHSVRELGVTDYGAFAVAALIADINIKDPKIIKAITDFANEKLKDVPFADQLSPEVRKARIKDIVKATTTSLQTAIEQALVQINNLLQLIGEKTKKGHDVEFEAAADRRAISLASASGYDPAALLAVLARLKKDNGGFGEAYPVDRDVLAKTFAVDYAVKKKVKTVGNYASILRAVNSLKAKDLFIR